MDRIDTIEQLDTYRQALRTTADTGPVSISVAGGTCGYAAGAGKVIDAFRKELRKRGLAEQVHLRITGCQGFCACEPLAVIYPGKTFYQKLTSKDVAEIIDETILNGRIIERLLYTHPVSGEAALSVDDIPFYNRQRRELLAATPLIDPLDITDYIARGGYASLSRALTLDPEFIIREIQQSGLRGRGGAGFSTGRKWASCRNAQDEPRFVICNADEGDPGAFMDRSLLEGNPHSVLEGMIIGAYAIGSHQGYIYVRNEYPLAIKHFSQALEQARACGFLGENILDSGFDFDIRVHRGGGAFVCGESSALRASIEGRVGEPSVKYIHATEHGLWNKPTVLNNVKTWASVTHILQKGAEWFAGIGTEKSKGTMIFALVGKVNHSGLVEVPMGMKLRELIYDIGGGILDNRQFKAVQTGGPSGGCIPAALLDLPVDYEALTEAGSMMGSGGMIVMDETTCMVHIAKYFLTFTQQESCGKCIPCREGIKHMLAILTRITEGNGRDGDIELLESMGRMIKTTSLCQLGGAAPNPVLSTIRYFRDEYESHIDHKRCPSKVCRALITYRIVADKCNGCTLCTIGCPEHGIIGEKKKPHSIDQNLCSKCGLCYDACNYNAIEIQ